MGKIRRRIVGSMLLFLLAGLLVPGIVLAAGDKASPIVIVADTQGLPAWLAWWGNLYNDSRLYFTILTVVTIPVVGLIFGIMADLVMGAIGLDLKSRDLAEH